MLLGNQLKIFDLRGYLGICPDGMLARLIPLSNNAQLTTQNLLDIGGATREPTQGLLSPSLAHGLACLLAMALPCLPWRETMRMLFPRLLLRSLDFLATLPFLFDFRIPIRNWNLIQRQTVDSMDELRHCEEATVGLRESPKRKKSPKRRTIMVEVTAKHEEE